ncbi:MAG: LysE family transporter [Spirosomataceae bacterium]
MIFAALYGLFTGILLCLTFGTVFFALIQASIERGPRSGVQIALGVVVSDAFFVFTAIFGTSFLPNQPFQSMDWGYWHCIFNDFGHQKFFLK